jgi:DNA-binding XRE family transcriptional regulator
MKTDDGSWHDEMRDAALRDPEVLAEYNKFKLEFELVEQLKMVRKQKNLSQQAIADRMKSSKSAIARLESVSGQTKHSPSLSTLRRYASAIGCHLEIKVVPDAFT